MPLPPAVFPSNISMRLISFDIFRTLGFPETRNLKPDQIFQHKAELREADWILFPEHWQLNALVYGLQCRVFPSQASYLIGHNKVEMTRAFSALVPEHTPTTHILSPTADNAQWLWEKMDVPFVAKLSKSSMGEGVWLIEERAQWLAYLEQVARRGDCLYVQEWLPIERDIRVVVVGDQVLAAYWRERSDYSFHNNVARGGRIDYSPVPKAATELALRVARDLGVDHAGFDIAMVGQHPYLLEFNRLFGNQGIPGGGQALREAILNYLERQSRQEGPNHDSPNDDSPNDDSPDELGRPSEPVAA